MTGDSTAYGTKVNNAELIINYSTKVQLGATYTANFQTAAAPSTYTVTYTDGVDGEEVFADQVYADLAKDSATPAFVGEPARVGEPREPVQLHQAGGDVLVFIVRAAPSKDGSPQLQQP